MFNVLTFAEMLEDSNTRAGGIYKWVRVKPAGAEADDEVFRFIKVNYHENHGMLVEDGEQALAAGTIVVRDDSWKLPWTGGWGSTTLKVGCDEHHARDLEAVLTAAGRLRQD